MEVLLQSESYASLGELLKQETPMMDNKYGMPIGNMIQNKLWNVIQKLLLQYYSNFGIVYL